MNLIPKVAEMLGVEVGEVFWIRWNNLPVVNDILYRFSETKFESCTADNIWSESSAYMSLINGNAEIVKLPFEPKKGETYYFVWFYNPTCTIKTMSGVWNESCTDYQNKYCGNRFRTQREAEKHKYEVFERVTGKRWKE